jgi:hypothetical protein
MRYGVVVSSRAYESIEDLPFPVYSQIIDHLFGPLAENPIAVSTRPNAASRELVNCIPLKLRLATASTTSSPHSDTCRAKLSWKSRGLR